MAQTKQAVKQQQTDNTLTVKTVMVNEKLSASFLVPDYNEGQILAVVDENVLNILRKLLPSADIAEIMHQFHEQTEKVYSLDQWVALLRKELAFHQTVNLMRQYFDPKVVVTKEHPFNIEPKPLTFEEMKLRYESMITEMDMLQTMIKEHADNPANVAEVVPNH